MTPEQEKEFIELLPTNVLYEALMARFDSAIFFGQKPRPEVDDPRIKIISMRWKGDPHLCQGMACSIIASCEAWMAKDTWDIPSEDL